MFPETFFKFLDMLFFEKFSKLGVGEGGGRPPEIFRKFSSEISGKVSGIYITAQD
jgi:hypothetical protein